MDVGFENQPVYTEFAASVVSVGTSAVQLPAGKAGLAFVKASDANTGKVTLGGASVAAGSGWVLDAGASLPVVLESLDSVYAVADAAAQTLEILVLS